MRACYYIHVIVSFFLQRYEIEAKRIPFLTEYNAMEDKCSFDPVKIKREKKKIYRYRGHNIISQFNISILLSVY